MSPEASALIGALTLHKRMNRSKIRNTCPTRMSGMLCRLVSSLLRRVPRIPGPRPSTLHENGALSDNVRSDSQHYFAIDFDLG